MSEDAVHRIQRAKRSAEEYDVALREAQAADDRGDIVKHAGQGRLAGRHAVATVFGEEDIAPSLAQPVREAGKIVRDDLAVAMEVDHGFRSRIDDVVGTREPAPIDGINPIGLRERLVAWEKIAA